MFAYMAGVPLSEYIRRRRMSLAAADLQVAGKKIVDIALDFGYNLQIGVNDERPANGTSWCECLQ